jgi:hypothetical protein
MKCQRSKRPLALLVPGRTTVEVVVMPVRKIYRQYVAVDGVSHNPSQRRFLSLDILGTNRPDLKDQRLIWWQIEWFVGDNDLPIEMCVYGHRYSCAATCS